MANTQAQTRPPITCGKCGEQLGIGFHYHECDPEKAELVQQITEEQREHLSKPWIKRIRAYRPSRDLQNKIDGWRRDRTYG